MATTKLDGIRLARRLDEVGFSDIVQIRNKVMAMRAEGLQVHSLHGGEPYFETPDEIKFAAVRRWSKIRRTTRPPPAFCRSAKCWLRSSPARTPFMSTTDEVIATVGGSQALYAAFQSVLDPGDDALVFSPYWTPIGDLVTGDAGASAAGAHHHRAAQWDPQNARAVLHAQDARHLLQHSAESQRPGLHARLRRKKLPPSPSNAI